GFWQQYFGGDAGVIGRTIPLSGHTYTVVGVMPRSFSLPENSPEIFASLRVVYPDAARYRGVHFLRTYWRLRPGVTVERAQAEMGAIDQRLAEAYPAENKSRRTRLVPLHERVVGDTRPALLILFGAVGLLLLIACANFANLSLARAAARQREFVIRAALGAGRPRLVRQLLTESVLLALTGGAAGLVLALWGIDLLLALKPANLPRLSDIRLDGRVLLFTLSVSVLTGIIFGLAPAWNAAGADVNEVLKEGGRVGGTTGAATRRVRGLLVVSEVSLALVLLVGAGLLVKSFWGLRTVDPGFDPGRVLTMRLELPETRYREIPKQTQFRERVVEAVNALPGAQAALVSEVPMSGDALFHNFVIEGRPPIAEGDEPELHSRSVGGDYFGVMRIPVRAGRGLTPRDREGSPLVGVVNEAMARQYFAGESPLGKRIRWARMEGEPQWITIVGVVGDVRQFGLDQPEEPAVYTPYAQSLQPWKRWMS
ncbi:MAG: ABC transporter permease, partial [Pyrinomonadaceae bacterium]